MSPLLSTPAIGRDAESEHSAGNDTISTTAAATLKVRTTPGAKAGAGIYQRIINQIPPHKFYLEPFLGTGAVMWAKLPAHRDVGVDINGVTMSAAQKRFAGRRGTQFLQMSGLTLLESLAAEMMSAADDAGNGHTRVSPFPGTRAIDTEPAVSFRNAPSDLIAVDGPRQQNHSRDRAIIFGDAGILTAGLAPRDVVVYADPPYLMSTRRGQKRLYAFEPALDGLTDVSWHERLLAALCALPYYVLLSGYWSDLYADRLRDWRAINYQASTHVGQVTEYLWCNFDEPLALHDYRYLGSDRRERRRIKMKKQRWVAKLRGMPRLERQALLAAMKEL